MATEAVVAPRVLVVIESGKEIELCSHYSAYKTIEHRFVETVSPTGLSAWKEPGDDGCQLLINVLAQCKPLAGGFKQQALNRIVGPLLLR
ncbi:MAG: hypothetical protein DRQ47_08970, partial [Gammaproteobacteria bacterium]